MLGRSCAAAGVIALALSGPSAADPAKSPSATLGFEATTQVDSDVLQVIFGERALFRLDDAGQPVLDSVEKGQLKIAHPPGAAAETFAAPGPGLMALALDGSAEVGASTMKVWNHTGRAMEFRAIGLVLHEGKLRPFPLGVCPVPPGGVRSQSWPAPIVAVGVSRFKPATKQDLANPACRTKKGK